MASLPAYHYNALKSDNDNDDSSRAVDPSTHIRLLVLDGGESAGPISCSLEQYRLADASDHEAVSYVWGDHAAEHDIVCSGQRLAITNNLYSALCRFRLVDKKRTL